MEPQVLGLIRGQSRPRLSICIPTYNRGERLADCLNSIRIAGEAVGSFGWEVCISDNGSSDATSAVVKTYSPLLPLRYHRNPHNLGIPRNFINVVRMAEGEFCWLLGDDDLLVPEALRELAWILDTKTDVDFLFVNSYSLTTEYVDSHVRPFDTRKLPEAMAPFSPVMEDRDCEFFDLIDPSVSFDFLGGMFLSVFRRSLWVGNEDVLAKEALTDPRIFSHFDNTFPHVRIFASAYNRSRAAIRARPLSVCLTGAREWAPMYSLVHSVRLVEALQVYRRHGLPLGNYLRCRDFAVRNAVPEFTYILLNGRVSGRDHFSLLREWKRNWYLPSLYLSPFLYIFRKMRGWLAE
jgi:glycosyltransferase involved in cell wall biosynthesis